MLLATLTALSIAVGASSMPADSTRPDADIRDVALRHAAQVRRCYETEGLRVNPSLSGTVEVELTVLSTGRVDSVAVSSSELQGDGKKEVEACIVAVTRQWRFDRGPYATEIIVYPFALDRSSTVTQVSRGA